MIGKRYSNRYSHIPLSTKLFKYFVKHNSQQSKVSKQILSQWTYKNQLRPMNTQSTAESESVIPRISLKIILRIITIINNDSFILIHFSQMRYLINGTSMKKKSRFVSSSGANLWVANQKGMSQHRMGVAYQFCPEFE